MKTTQIATEKLNYISIRSEGVKHIVISKDHASFDMELQNYNVKIIGETLVIEKTEDGENITPWEE